ncbi:helix-turn-helix transcriptional regulator [Bosea sp. (in: a-proteobacteria)]|uniref:helix-turn-helix domain-containing protein n=1 Tax=Bosea sp. (in: a-proteobacteria) TaxID=1871050 RepID=UPI002623A10A|nr:helix-turn-helix transcriptional regulator [Bosea sp. (in: a-proteobacteria)]MCO5092189.1 helix-turn-helix domain-containing protein [Bosea sp. (in: a-proteobacteria)]
MTNENAIQALREARGLTQEQLAERVGLSISYVSRLEKGRRNLSVKHIDRFAAALGVPRERLLTKEDVPLTEEDQEDLALLRQARDRGVIGEVRMYVRFRLSEIEGTDAPAPGAPVRGTVVRKGPK